MDEDQKKLATRDDCQLEWYHRRLLAGIERKHDAPEYLRCFCGHVAKTSLAMGEHLHIHIGSEWLPWVDRSGTGPVWLLCFCGLMFCREDYASAGILCSVLQDHFERTGGPVTHFLEHQLGNGG